MVSSSVFWTLFAHFLSYSLLVFIYSIIFGYSLSFCQFGIFHVVFFVFLCCLWASQSYSAYVALLHLPLVLAVLSFTFLPAQVISAPYILLYVCSTSAVSFSIGAIVACDAMQMPFVLFGLYFSSASHCQCFGCEPPSLLFGVAFFVFCCPFAVFIPSHCVLVSWAVPFFRGALVTSLAIGEFVHRSISVVGVFFPCSLVLGSGFCGPSASLGSLVPFATWSPFGTSQGWLFPLYRLVLWFHSHIRLLLGRFSVKFSYDSFECVVPLATWSPCGMSQDFAGSSRLACVSGFRFGSGLP